MTSEELVVPPPKPKVMDYPASVGMTFGVIFVAVLLVVAGRFDPTHGALTISLMVVVLFAGTVTFCLFFTVPQDQTTAMVTGGLVAAFGAVISFWLTPKNKDKE